MDLTHSEGNGSTSDRPTRSFKQMPGHGTNRTTVSHDTVILTLALPSSAFFHTDATAFSDLELIKPAFKRTSMQGFVQQACIPVNDLFSEPMKFETTGKGKTSRTIYVVTIQI